MEHAGIVYMLAAFMWVKNKSRESFLQISRLQMPVLIWKAESDLPVQLNDSSKII